MAACAAIALAKPTAITLTAKNAFIQPVFDAAWTRVKKALPASSSLNASRPPASRLASQVCATKRKATTNSAMIMARPAGFLRPVDSSASVEMPSKPRKLSTAIDSAVAIRGAVTVLGVPDRQRAPAHVGQDCPLIARTAMTMKITTNTSSMARNTRLASFSELMPSRLMMVFTTTKTIAHNQRGVPGNRPTIDSAANT